MNDFQIQDTLLGIAVFAVGGLISFVGYSARSSFNSLSNRFDTLISQDHVHRYEFESLRRNVEDLVRTVGRLEGRLAAHEQRDSASTEGCR